MITDLTSVKTEVEDWDTMLFATCYHDIIYKATSSTNEDDSSKIALRRLNEIGYPEEKINKCAAMILATKLHQVSIDDDTNFLIDADLAILGQKADVYQQYAENVRKEYSIYPDFVYNSGRKKVLQHFLEMNSIFKTNYFINKYEAQARKNIQNELDDIEP
jgi:predicted metal-dependent HD superfamily phosphohydrolase